MSRQTRSAWVKLNLLSLSVGLLLLTAQPVAAGFFTTGVVTTPADVQQGSGAGWLAEDTGSTTSTTIGSATFAAENHFVAGYLQGTASPALGDADLNDLLDDFRYGQPSATLPTVMGATYNLQLLFFDPSYPTYQAGSRVMNITVGSDTLTAFDVIATSGGTNGAKVDYLFVASGNSVNVALTPNVNSVDGNMFLSGFSLLAVPEPGTFSIFALSGIGLALRCRRRQSR